MSPSTSKMLSLAVLAIAVAASPALAQSVGNVGAVNQDAHGAPPGGASRTLDLGQVVVRNERVQTDARGSTQIAFTDGSAMTIGHDSSVVIDNYVYNPETGAGAQGASLLRGAMRFVGGRVSHGEGMSIKTPTATIGVRGGLATVVLEPMGRGKGSRLRVISHFGLVTIENAAGRMAISRPDFEVAVDGAGLSPRAVGVVSADALSRIALLMTSQGRQRGGATTYPTDAMLTRSGLDLPRAGVAAPSFDIHAVGDRLTGADATPVPGTVKRPITTGPAP